VTNYLFPTSLSTNSAGSPGSSGNPAQRVRPVIEIGALIARTFDLLEGTSFEPFAPQIASGLINGARHRRQG